MTARPELAPSLARFRDAIDHLAACYQDDLSGAVGHPEWLLHDTNWFLKCSGQPELTPREFGHLLDSAVHAGLLTPSERVLRSFRPQARKKKTTTIIRSGRGRTVIIDGTVTVGGNAVVAGGDIRITQIVEDEP